MMWEGKGVSWRFVVRVFCGCDWVAEMWVGADRDFFSAGDEFGIYFSR